VNKTIGQKRKRLEYSATSQGMLRIASNHKKLVEKQEMDSPSEHPEGSNPAKIWISGFDLLNYATVVLSHPVCGNFYSSPEKLLKEDGR
jgi:hypothetical protein